MHKDYSYEFEHDDFYCYPGSDVLKNKLNISDRNLFFKAEREITSLRTAQALLESIPGAFDFEHLCAIHHFLFSDIYDWAGKIRTLNISKGNTFCHVNFIESELHRVFTELESDRLLTELRTPQTMAERLAYYLSEINAIHPFREGNGRTQRLFIILLARHNGYDLNFATVTADEMIKASDESFFGNYSTMTALIARSLTKQA